MAFLGGTLGSALSVLIYLVCILAFAKCVDMAIASWALLNGNLAYAPPIDRLISRAISHFASRDEIHKLNPIRLLDFAFKGPAISAIIGVLVLSAGDGVSIGLMMAAAILADGKRTREMHPIVVMTALIAEVLLAFAAIYRAVYLAAPHSIYAQSGHFVGVDALYMSIITTTTLGYANVHPSLWQAEVPVMVQTLLSMALISIFFAGLISARETGQRAPGFTKGIAYGSTARSDDGGQPPAQVDVTSTDDGPER
jgi:hypothetical protein